MAGVDLHWMFNWTFVPRTSVMFGCPSVLSNRRFPLEKAQVFRKQKRCWWGPNLNFIQCGIGVIPMPQLQKISMASCYCWEHFPVLHFCFSDSDLAQLQMEILTATDPTYWQNTVWRESMRWERNFQHPLPRCDPGYPSGTGHAPLSTPRHTCHLLHDGLTTLLPLTNQ